MNRDPGVDQHTHQSPHHFHVMKLRGKLQALQFHGLRLQVRQVVVGLLDKPAFGAAAEYLFQPHGHGR